MHKSATLWLPAALVLIVVFIGAAPKCGFAATGISEPTLSFDVKEGLNLNSFLRSGPVAAHLVLRSGLDPRILVAFPAGNSGVAVWFSHTAVPVIWKLDARPQAVSMKDGKGRPLFGMAIQATATTPELITKKVLLSSVRVFRDYQYWGKSPAEVSTLPTVHGRTIIWERDRLDGAAGYYLSMEITHGEIQDGRLSAGDDGKIGMVLSAFTGETPLTPLAGRELINDSAEGDAAVRSTLEFSFPDPRLIDI